MISMLRFTIDRDEDAFADAAQAALRVLAARPGYLSGSVSRASDDPTQWLLIAHWRDVGSYRRALGAYEVKVQATPFLARATGEISAFEELIDAQPSAEPVRHSSDRAAAGD